MFVIGLTGGIGTGKSQVSKLLENLGAEVVNADLLGHEVYRRNSEGWRAVVDAFGEEILNSDGDVDRSKLGPIVFSDEKQLEKLNSITHPRIYRLAEERIKSLAEQGAEVVVLEAALLVEAGWAGLVDELWVTVSPEDQVVRRIQERNNLDEEAIRARIGSQMPQAERVEYANVIVENSDTLEDLSDKIKKLWSSRTTFGKENVR